MWRIVLAAAALAGCASAAMAEEAGVAPLEACIAAAGESPLALEACRGVILDPCIKTEGGETTYGMVQCYGAESAAWAVQMNAALERARADEARRAWLEPAQQAWSAWRDAECAYRASRFLGGSMARVLAAACIADLTATRAIDLIRSERAPD